MLENVRCYTFKTSICKDVLANLITFKLNNHTHGDNTNIENPEQTLIFRHEGSYALTMTQFEVTSQ